MGGPVKHLSTDGPGGQVAPGVEHAPPHVLLRRRGCRSRRGRRSGRRRRHGRRPLVQLGRAAALAGLQLLHAY